MTHSAETECWCGREHSGRTLADQATAFGHLFLLAMKAPQAVALLDRLLRRWPRLYRRLGGP